MKPSRLLLSLAALGGPLTTAALAQGTAFTYQGRLDDGGTPATGLYDLSFTVYNAATGGTSAGTRNVDNVGVTNGLFTVTLDFGAGVFAGAPEWLEIAVRPGASTGAYTGLVPRQAITPTPYALYAGGASATGLTGTLPSAALGGTYAGVVNFSNKGNAFAGNAAGLTNLPASNLTGTVADARLSANVALRAGGNAFSGTQTFNNGNVGIGLPNPVFPLEVNGNARFAGGVVAGGAGVVYGLWGDTGNIALRAQNGGNIYFQGANGGGTNMVWNPNVGRLGIGTPTPIAPLEVSGTEAAPALNANNQLMSVRGGPNLIGLNFGHYPSGSFASWIQSQRTADSSVWPLVLNPVGGNVGIGVATPVAKLELYDTGTYGLRVQSQAGGTLASFGAGGDFKIDAPAFAGGRLTVKESGNVGIGTAAPSAKLEVVNGADGANAIAVTQTGHGASAIYASNTSGDGYAGYFNGAVGVSSEITCTAINLTSDRNAKEKFKPVNPREVLAKVVDLPITEWQYKSAGDARHLGPMAQDFHAAFALGHDDRHITSIDEDGVALAAIQGLNEKLEERNREVADLKQSVAELRELVGRLTAGRNGGAK